MLRFSSVLVLILSVTYATAAASQSSADFFKSALEIHLTTHSQFQPDDVYKFTHQSVFGPGHLMPAREVARNYLEREAASVDLAQADPFCEELSQEPPLSRLHLAAALRRGGGIQSPEWPRMREAILDGMEAGIALALTGDAGRAEMERRLAIAREFSNIDPLVAEMAPRGYPAIHHSKTFVEAYRPAYRVVTQESCRALSQL